jgi:hypothetical protein
VSVCVAAAAASTRFGQPLLRETVIPKVETETGMGLPATLNEITIGLLVPGTRSLLVLLVPVLHVVGETVFVVKVVVYAVPPLIVTFLRAWFAGIPFKSYWFQSNVNLVI